jgi:hypothetical protein
MELFRQARQQDYIEINTQAEELESKVNKQQKIAALEIKDAIAKLRKRYSEILTIDFFDCPDARLVAAKLTQIEQSLKEENEAST